MDFNKRIVDIYKQFSKLVNEGKKMFCTSSFQTQSLILLKIISDYDRTIPVYFLNTGFHFPETIIYKNQLTDLLGLKVIDIYSEVPMAYQVNANGRLLYTSDTDRCCEMNKTIPLQKILAKYDVWITGIRWNQTQSRKIAKKIERLESGKLKYNPVIDWTENIVSKFIDYLALPKHPLDPDGLMSVGCQPCTRLVKMQSRNQNRWFGQTKTECGLHLNFKEGP